MSFLACIAYSVGDCVCLSVCVDVFCQTKSLLLPQFFSDSHKTRHTWFTYQYAKNGTDFWNFAFKIFRILLKILHRRLSSYHTRWTEFLSAAPPPPPEIFSRHLVGGYSREHWLVPVCKKKHHLVGWLRWGPRLVSRLGSAVRVSASFLNFSLGVISGGGVISARGYFRDLLNFGPQSRWCGQQIHKGLVTPSGECWSSIAGEIGCA